MLPVLFSPIDSRCHENEILDIMDYNSTSARDICEIFASIEGFLGLSHRMLPMKFCPDFPWLPWQRKIGAKWAITRLLKRYLSDFCIYKGSFGVVPSNATNKILPHLTIVAMVTKFGTKWDITRLL